MTEPNGDFRLVENSLPYKIFARQRDEILRYRWIESEKAGVDIGFEKALLGWLVKNRAGWQGQRQSEGGLKTHPCIPDRGLRSIDATQASRSVSRSLPAWHRMNIR